MISNSKRHEKRDRDEENIPSKKMDAIKISLIFDAFRSQSRGLRITSFTSSISLLSIILIMLTILNSSYCFTGLIITTFLMVLHFVTTSLDLYCETIVNSSLNDFNILEKATDLTVHVYSDTVVTINITKNTRSRYSKYLYYNYRHVKLSSHG